VAAPVAPAADPSLPYAEARRRALEGFERAYLRALLDAHGGKVALAARAAGIDRVYLYRLMRRHGVAAAAPDPTVS
jgi:transcriptional regulator of acetoin/glycerol metabolism